MLTAGLEGRLSQSQQETILANRSLLLLMLGRKDACRAALASFAKRCAYNSKYMTTSPSRPHLSSDAICMARLPGVSCIDLRSNSNAASCLPTIVRRLSEPAVMLCPTSSDQT